MINRRRFNLSLGAAGASLGWAQDPGVIRVETRRVVAPTSVLDKSGSFVSGLDKSNFTIYDNGKKQEIDNVDISFIPISLVVCIQRSANTEKVLPSIMRIGSMFEGVITGDQGEIAIMSFDHRIEVMQDFTIDTKLISDALSKLRPGSDTRRMNDAVMQATRMLGRRDRGNNRRKIILLIAETQDRGSEIKIREVLRQLEVDNVTVYPVNMSRWMNQLGARTPVPRPDPIPNTARVLPGGAANTPTTVMQNYGTGGGFGNYAVLIKEVFTAVKAVFIDNPQEVYAKYTGGREHNFVGLKGLEEAIQKVGDELHSQYLLSYNPTAEVRAEGGWHAIQVEVNRRGLDVHTRAGYWSAAKFEP